MEGNIITNIASLTIGHDDDDRISDLPDFIAHHILFYLLKFPKELIRMSTLSKKWLSLTASFPFLVFHFEDFIRAKYPLPGVPYDLAGDTFLKFVEYSTSRFSKQKFFVSADRFSLFGELQDPAHASIIGRCLGPILKQGLQSFGIFNCGISRDDFRQPIPMYRLPDKLLSVSSLTYLTIHYCKLPSSLMVDDDAVKFKSLKVLCLTGLDLNEEMIKRLTSGCPLLEEFKVQSCYGFKRLSVYGLQNLQNVVVFYRDAVEEIDIQAPNLLYVRLFHMGRRDKPPCVNLFSCQKLSMIFEGCISKQFVVSLSNFPFLETLILKLPFKYKDKNLKLSSHSLKTLSIETLTDLDEIKIDTPNLLYFQYTCRKSDVHRPINNSGESKVCMDCYHLIYVDTVWFQKLRRFLDTAIAFKVLKLRIFANSIDVEELKLLELSPFELDHIELYLNIDRELSEHVPVVNAVLWCCRPRSFALRSYSCFDDLKERDHIVKFTCEKLLEQEDEGQTNIQIVFSTVKAFGSVNHLITFSKVSQEAG